MIGAMMHTEVVLAENGLAVIDTDYDNLGLRR